MNRIKKIITTILIITLAVTLTCCGKPTNSQEFDDSKPFVLTFITIGKGDAFLLTMPDGSHYMIDTGKEEDFIQIGKVLKEKNISVLDGIFLSHGHLDHTGSLKGILDTFNVKKVYMSLKDTVSYKKADINKMIEGTRTEIVYLEGGEEFNLGGVNTKIWIPKEVDEENENNNSVVMKLTYGNISCLMTGDMELEEEVLYMAENKDIEADILKLGHHGEMDASSDKFLKKVNASIGIVCGNKEENAESVTVEMKNKLDKYKMEVMYSDSEYMAVDYIINGKSIELKYIEKSEENIKSNIKIAGFSKKDETITLENTGDSEVVISDYVIVSEKEKEIYVVPDNTVINPDSSLTLDSGKMWKKKDKALLYDNNFNFLYRFDKENE